MLGWGGGGLKEWGSKGSKGGGGMFRLGLLFKESSSCLSLSISYEITVGYYNVGKNPESKIGPSYK
jgi:hypothetical protein